MIRVKDLSIHEDAAPKEGTKISYDAVQADDNLSAHTNKVIQANEVIPVQPKRKRGRPQKTETTKALITMLSEVLSEPQWQPTADVFHAANDSNPDDPFVLLAKHLEEVQAYGPEAFALVTQFDIIEPVTYKAAMSGKLAEKWAEAAVIEYNQLVENET